MLDAPESGDYEAYVRWPGDVPGAARKAEFTIDHDGGNDTFVVNQRVDGNQWNLLGIFSFTAGTGEVTLGDGGRRRHVLADAVRIVKTGLPSGPAQVFYYHDDHLGTPNRITDDSGTVVWAANYEPFGSALVGVDIVANNLRFPGQYFDAETGLHYNYFRDYDPSIGRYLQSDPVGLRGGPSTFLYVGANPLYWIDPMGLDRECIFFPYLITHSASGQTQDNITRRWDDTRCGPGFGIGAPFPPDESGSDSRKRRRNSVIDLINPKYLCQTTYYMAGHTDELYMATGFGVLRCYSDCGKLVDSVIGYKRLADKDEWRKIEDSEFEESHAGRIYEADKRS